MTVIKTQQPTSASAWLNSGELVELPSGNVARCRPVDIMTIIDNNGDMPNIIQNQLNREQDGTPPSNPSFNEVIEAMPFLNRIARAVIVEPKIVSTVEQVEAGEGIMLEHIALNDKFALMTFAMGGKEAVEAARNFLQEQSISLDGLQASD